MLSSSARSLRYSRVASQQCRSFQSSIPKLDGRGDSSFSALSSLDLGAGRGTSNGAINQLNVPRSQPSSSSRSPIPPSPTASSSSQAKSGQFDHALEDLDFDDDPSSSSSKSALSSAEAANQRRERGARSPAFGGVQNDGKRVGPYVAPRGGPSGGRGGFSARGGAGGDRGGARGGRGGRGRGARGRGAGASSRLQVVQVQPPANAPAFAPSTLPSLDTLYAADDYFFATPSDVPLSRTPAPIFPVRTPLQAKLDLANKQFAGLAPLAVIYNRTRAKFLPEKFQGPRFDLIKERMKAYDLMMGREFEQDTGAAKELIEKFGGQEGLVKERELERLGKYERFFDNEDISETVEDGVALEESTRGSREAARGLARLGMSWNGEFKMQEKEEMMKILEGLLVPPKKKVAKVVE